MHIYVKSPAVWKQYNKMAVLHFFLVNSPLIYILFSLVVILNWSMNINTAIVLSTNHRPILLIVVGDYIDTMKFSI